jgi:hypothetical protein
MELHMRTTLLLLSAAFVLSACADDQHATAPGNTRRATGSASSNTVPPDEDGPVNQAKPSAAFSVVFSVKTGLLYLLPGISGSVNPACPVGSQVVGGGYVLAGNAAQLVVTGNGPNATNGWTVSGNLPATATGWVSLQGTALCIK